MTTPGGDPSEAPPSVVTDVLADAGAALAARRWVEAHRLLADADAAHRLESPDALQLLAQAAYLSGDPESAVRAFERLHAMLVAQGEPGSAAGSALQIAFIQYDALMLAPSRAWLRRAERLVEDAPESAVHAGTRMLRAWHAMTTGDLELSGRLARESVAIAERVGDRDTAALARIVEGRTLMATGELEPGMEILDESALAAAAGELGPLATGIVFCATACAYQSASDYERAEQWTRAMEQWSSTMDLVAFQGRCRVHRAQLKRLHGDWPEAAREAGRAADELSRVSPPERGWALTELAQVRLRLGDLEGADAAFSEAFGVGWDPEPGRALLLLARGHVDEAQRAIRDALDAADPIPSREVPPLGPLRRAPLLAAAVEIGVAADDVRSARSAADELQETAATFQTSALRATAAAARGAIELADGDHVAAQRSYGSALATWLELDAPYEAARARMGLGTAARGAGNEERANREFSAAHAAFLRLRAVLDARRAATAAPAVVMADHAERRVRTFMFTDIVKSTNLLEAVGDEAWRALLRWHAETLERLIATHGGVVETGTGDGYFATFETEADGVRAAAAIQRALADHRRHAGFAPRVRIGLHTAEADTDGRTWMGLGVHVAARVGAASDGDEILATRATADATDLPFGRSEPRSLSLRGISQPVEVVSIDWR